VCVPVQVGSIAITVRLDPVLGNNRQCYKVNWPMPVRHHYAIAIISGREASVNRSADQHSWLE